MLIDKRKFFRKIKAKRARLHGWFDSKWRVEDDLIDETVEAASALVEACLNQIRLKHQDPTYKPTAAELRAKVIEWIDVEIDCGQWEDEIEEELT